MKATRSLFARNSSVLLPADVPRRSTNTVSVLPVVLQRLPKVAMVTHVAPSKYQNSFKEVSYTSSPSAGAGIALRCTVVMRGTSRPFLPLAGRAVTSTSSKAEGCGAAPFALMPMFWAATKAPKHNAVNTCRARRERMVHQSTRTEHGGEITRSC